MKPFIHPPKAKRSIVRDYALGAFGVVVILAAALRVAIWAVN